MSATREPFGAFLVRHQFVSDKVMEDALQNQGILGGRLGTNLVEIGALSLDKLEEFLGLYFGIPAIGPSDLDQVSSNLLQTVPRRLIEKYKFLPLQRSGKNLRVAAMDPQEGNFRQEVEGVLAIKIEPLVASEIRLVFYLDQYCNMKAEIRYRSLFFHYRKSRALGKELPFQPQIDTGKRDLIKKGFKPLEKGEELTDDGFEEYLLEQSMAKLAPPPPSPPPVILPPTGSKPVIAAADVEFAEVPELKAVPGKTPAASSLVLSDQKLLTLEDLDQKLPEIRERFQIAELALQYASQFVENAILFVVNSGLVSGWDARGKQLSKDNVRSIILPQTGDCVFQTVLDTKNHFIGRLSPKPLNQRLLTALAMKPEQEFLTVPVFMKKRPVNVLMACNLTEPLSQPSIQAVLKLTQWLPRAYEQLILNKKNTLKESLEKT